MGHCLRCITAFQRISEDWLCGISLDLTRFSNWRITAGYQSVYKPDVSDTCVLKDCGLYPRDQAAVRVAQMGDDRLNETVHMPFIMDPTISQKRFYCSNVSSRKVSFDIRPF